MDIFEELFGDVLSKQEVSEMITLRKAGLLRTSYKGDPKLRPNHKQLDVFKRVMLNVYRLAEIDKDIRIIPPDITPDTAFRINLEVPYDMNFSGRSLTILQHILPHVSAFGFGIKGKEMKADYEGDVETVEIGFVIPDVYEYPFDESEVK